MFAAATLFVAASTLLSAALPLPIANQLAARDDPSAEQPADWWTAGLEPYADYHERYMELDCLAKHNTSFFDACCHPLLKTETLEANREPMCNPANLDCDGDDDNSNHDAPAPKASTPSPKASSPAPKASTPAAAPPKAPVNVAPAPSEAPVNVAPAPKESPKAAAPAPAPAPKPAPAPAPAPAPKPAPAPAPKPSPAPAPSNGGVKTGGSGTWFTQNGVAGACGTVHQDSDKVVALDSAIYNNGEFCGKTVSITDVKSGKTFDAIVADECPTCENADCLDMSTSLFQEFNPLSVGEFAITWEFKN